MKTILAVGTGSFIGGISRYLLTLFVQNKIYYGFPFGTLAVNIAGCLVIGLVYGLGESENVSPGWQLFLSTGIIGGFTTFSAFSIETVNMIRDGHIIFAVVYVAASIILGLLAAFAGVSAVKIF